MPTPCLHRKVIAIAGQSILDDKDMRSLTSHIWLILQPPVQDFINFLPPIQRKLPPYMTHYSEIVKSK